MNRSFLESELELNTERNGDSLSFVNDLFRSLQSGEGSDVKTEVLADFVSGTESKVSILADLSSDAGVSVNGVDDTSQEFGLFVNSVVSDLTETPVSSILVNTGEGELAESVGESFSGLRGDSDVLSVDVEVLVDVVTEESVVLGDVGSGEVKITVDTSPEGTLVDGNLFSKTESRLVSVSELNSGGGIDVRAVVTSGNVSLNLVESGVTLEDGDEFQRLANVVVAPVGPESHNTLVVELGFEVSAFEVGKEFDFRRSDGDFFESFRSFTLDGLSLEAQTSLSVDNEARSSSLVLNGKKLFMGEIFSKNSVVVEVKELSEEFSGRSNDGRLDAGKLRGGGGETGHFSEGYDIT